MATVESVRAELVRVRELTLGLERSLSGALPATLEAIEALARRAGKPLVDANKTLLRQDEPEPKVESPSEYRRRVNARVKELQAAGCSWIEAHSRTAAEIMRERSAPSLSERIAARVRELQAAGVDTLAAHEKALAEVRGEK